MRINLGSGQRRFNDFINVDISDKFSPDIQLDSETYLKLQAADSVDMIVCHHSAEHMHLEESKSLFAQCHRVLRPGGSLLVFVPDLEALAHRWIEGRISDYIFCVNLHGAYMGSEADVHKWSFTEKSLKGHIHSCAQWCNVIKFDWRTVAGADLARDWWILGMEGIK